MIRTFEAAKCNIETYCTRKRLLLERQLGAGMDGIVYSTSMRTALKGFLYEKLYRNELEV